MSSFIANQVKTNMCSISVKFFIGPTTFVPQFTLNWYNTNYNNNCLFDTTICYSAYNRNSFFTRNFSQDCFNYNWTADRFIFIYVLVWFLFFL